MTRFSQLAVVLFSIGLGTSGCLVRARPVLPVVRVGPAVHVHHAGCGHHVKAIVVVR